MKTTLSLFAALLAASCSSSSLVDSNYAANFDRIMSLSEEEMMAEMMAPGMPGPQHAHLAESVGTWDVQMTMYSPPGVGEAPMTMTAVAEIEPILDGHYTLESFRGDFQGMPFNGLLIQGYDNLREDYFSIWIDSMSSGFIEQRGQMDADGVQRLTGTTRDKLTPGGRPLRSEVVHSGPDESVMRMYDVMPDGTEYLMIEGAYSRRR